jgi:hypothetical protein
MRNSGLNTLNFDINDNKQATVHTRKIEKFGRRSNISKNGKEKKINIFCSLTGPPREIQDW